MEAAVAGAQGRVEKVTEALVQIGYSEPLAAKLRAEEARLLDARQALATAAAVATPAPVSRAYSARAVLAVVKHLATAATATPLKAKELLGAVVDAILMQPTPDGYAVRVTLKTQVPLPWRAAGPVTTRLVAGAHNWVIKEWLGAGAPGVHRRCRSSCHGCLVRTQRAAVKMLVMGEQAPSSSGDEDALGEIIGSQLSAVTFVMDYVQLTFDGPRLTAVTCPVIETRGQVFRWGGRGYRDELCARIAKKVTSVRVGPDAIAIAFEDGALVTISLRAEDLSGRSAESAVFDGQHTVVFQPSN